MTREVTRFSIAYRIALLVCGSAFWTSATAQETPKVESSRPGPSTVDEADKTSREIKESRGKKLRKDKIKVRATVDIIDPTQSVDDIFSRLRKRDSKILDKARLERVKVRDQAVFHGSKKTKKPSHKGLRVEGGKTDRGSHDKNQRHDDHRKGAKQYTETRREQLDRFEKGEKSRKGGHERAQNRDDRKQRFERGERKMGDGMHMRHKEMMEEGDRSK